MDIVKISQVMAFALLFSSAQLLAVPQIKASASSPTETDKKATARKDSKQIKPSSSYKCEEIPEQNTKEKQLCETERKIAKLREEERLKVLFVDVNSVMERVGATMDWTANWIDGRFAESPDGKNKAKAWGHIQMGWEPREGEWLNFPIKFKVRATLPNLENKAELIFSDNEQEDLNRLPYETVRPDALKSSEKSLGAAVRFLHSTSENLKMSSRLGWGDGQLYARSSVLWNKKWLADKLTFNIQPSLEYYVSDGGGGRLLADLGYAINPRNEIKLSYLYQDRESFEAPVWRNGLYSVSAISDEAALIFGLTVAGVAKPRYRPEFYKLSVRIRKKAIRSWIFIEAEPFVEFSRNQLGDEFSQGQLYDDFERDIGIAIRIEAHYGFL